MALISSSHFLFVLLILLVIFGYASYLALALKLGFRLITADNQLAKAALSLRCLADGCLVDPAFSE